MRDTVILKKKGLRKQFDDLGLLKIPAVSKRIVLREAVITVL